MSPNDIDIAPPEKNNITVKSVTFSWNKDVIDKYPETIRNGLFSMAYAIRDQARMNAPVVTSALQNSIRVRENGNEIWVIAGGAASHGVMNGKTIYRYVDYAAKTEEKSSKPHYMQRAQESIMSGDWMQKYFGGITS